MDFTQPYQSFLVDKMAHLELAVTTFDVNWLFDFQQQHRLPMVCPSFHNLPNMTDIGPIVKIKQHEIYKREPLVATGSKSALTILVWVSAKNMDVAASIFENDVMRCKEKVEMGLLHKDNKIIFVSENKNNTITTFKSITQLSNQPKVAAMYQLNNHLVVWNVDYYSQSNFDGILLNRVKPLAACEESHFGSIFHQQKTFNGKILNVLNIPLAYQTQASYAKEPENKYKLYTDRWGMAIDMLKAMKDELNFNVEFWNPDPPWEFGTVTEDGSWNGGTGMLHDHTCDFVLDWGFDFERSQVSTLITYNLLDYETFASPLPQPLLHTWAITLPFDRYVWFSIIMSIPIMSVVNYIFAYLEGTTTNRILKPWDTFGGSFWYSFGTLQGESITRNINLSVITTLR